MDITMIVAFCDQNHVIGRNGEIPWPFLAKDLANFKARTLGKPCIMGRKTAESIQKHFKGKLLPGRTNIVLTRRGHFSDCPNTYSAESVREALVHAREHLNGHSEIMIIGGEEIYKQFFPYATRLVTTIVYGLWEGDAYFPRWDPGSWMLIEAEARAYPSTDSTPAFRIDTYARVGEASKAA